MVDVHICVCVYVLYSSESPPLRRSRAVHGSDAVQFCRSCPVLLPRFTIFKGIKKATGKNPRSTIPIEAPLPLAVLLLSKPDTLSTPLSGPPAVHPFPSAAFPFPTLDLPLCCIVMSRTKRFRSPTPFRTLLDKTSIPDSPLALLGRSPAAAVCPTLCSLAHKLNQAWRDPPLVLLVWWTHCSDQR